MDQQALAQMNGARLAFVAVPIAGKLTRPVYTYSKADGLKVEDKEKPGGWMVYFPRGHVVRVATAKLLKHYKLDRKPNIINLQGLNDPNSPIGQLVAAQDDAGRAGAMEQMRKRVIDLATAKTGKIVMPEQIESFEVEEGEPGETEVVQTRPRKPRAKFKRAA